MDKKKQKNPRLKPVSLHKEGVSVSDLLGAAMKVDPKAVEKGLKKGDNSEQSDKD